MKPPIRYGLILLGALLVFGSPRSALAQVIQEAGRYTLVRVGAGATWQEARADAEKRGGHLATFVNQQEWDGMVSLFGNFYNGLTVFLGATETNGSWQWVTGETWGFARWSSGAPRQSEPGVQRGLILLGNGLWDALPTSTPQGHYLMERYPRITAQPQSLNVIHSTGFSLSIAADGYEPFSLQWRFNGTALPGATNFTLNIANAQHTANGSYDVVLQNGAGIVTSVVARVRVTPVLEIQRKSNGFIELQLFDARALGWHRRT